MFTEIEKKWLVDALTGYQASLSRSKAKARNPKFAAIYDEDLRFVAALTMKVQALEVSDGKGKVAARP